MGTIRAGFSVFSIPIRVPRGNNELWALTDPPPLLSNLCALFVYLLALKYYLSTVLKASNTWQLHYILICLQLMNNLLKNMHQITKLSSDILKILKLDFDTCFLNISWPQVLIKNTGADLKSNLTTENLILDELHWCQHTVTSLMGEVTGATEHTFDHTLNQIV